MTETLTLFLFFSLFVLLEWFSSFFFPFALPNLSLPSLPFAILAILSS